MRWWWLLLVVSAASVGCSSVWERHQASLVEHEAQGDYVRAVTDAQWLIDHAFYHAPPNQQTPSAEAGRYLRLAQLATRSGNSRLAIEALREALMIDPHRADAVRAQLQALPLSEPDLERIKQEFAWNIAALQPGADAFLVEAPDRSDCWSYRVQEIRIRRRRAVSTAEGMQRQVTYDARPWVFDAHAGRWSADGAWMNDAGTETELVHGPPRPRYRALNTQSCRFYTDERVPPCHRTGWQGPYDSNGTVFIAARLPSGTGHRDH